MAWNTVDPFMMPTSTAPLLPAGMSATPFIHGTLYIILHEARGLPNTDGGWFSGGDKTDAYVRVIVDGKKGPKSATIQNCLDPNWGDEKIRIPLGGHITAITLSVKDEDQFKPDTLGNINISANEAIQGFDHRWFDLQGGGKLCCSMHFRSAESEVETAHVVNSPFHLWENCRVKLYADAHCSQETHARLPPIYTQLGPYRRNSCWEDMYCAIRAARHFIYITGWSVQTNISLLRERPLDNSGLIPLGDLLKQKADEGVRVNLLVWDEMMSLDVPWLNTLVKTTKNGLMSTHDEETRKFFAGTKVTCELVTRHGRGVGGDGMLSAASMGLSFMGPEAIFTHHQKSIICDCPTERQDGRAAVLAFVGGLDLTGGRFDTPEHNLCSTLQTWHRGDYYMCIPGCDEVSGPREPWHDIHCRVEGRVAFDVLLNFEQRWRKQVPKNLGALADMSRMPLLTREESIVYDPHPWTAQFFRSIDSHSAIDVPGIERGIQEAYIHNIRRAEHFIYIENQYFIGSSKEWVDFDDKKNNVDCKHQIPNELVAKIVSKIQKQQPFSVYVVLPLFPEGIPESGAVQTILFWQYKTIDMMYRKIAAALKMYGPPPSCPDANPTDYLNFYFLGNRDPNIPNGTGATPRQRKHLAAKRFMIYVHSKLMIVDDEYVILGSANINERSMAGDRDTEICVGAFQPSFVKNGNELPRGDVAAFRHSLWSEHLAIWEDGFLSPQYPVTVRRVNYMANHNWLLFTQQQPVAMTGHLCRYPYTIALDGAVSAVVEFIPDCEDEKAKVLGFPNAMLPTLLTT